jgi:hypothetical protein
VVYWDSCIYSAAVSVMSEPVLSTSPAAAATVISTTCHLFTVSELHGVTVIGTLVRERCAPSSAVFPIFFVQCREICSLAKLQVEDSDFMVTVAYYTYRHASANASFRLVSCVSKDTLHIITLSLICLLDNHFFVSHSKCTSDCEDEVN